MTNKKTAGKKPAVSKPAVAAPAAAVVPVVSVADKAPEVVVAGAPVASAVIPEADKAPEAATETPEAAPVVAEKPGESKPKKAKYKFPIGVTLRNNGPVPVVEPSTSSIVGSGGAVDVTVHSEGQLHDIVQNFAELAAINYIDPALLVIDGLPA